MSSPEMTTNLQVSSYHSLTPFDRMITLDSGREDRNTYLPDNRIYCVCPQKEEKLIALISAVFLFSFLPDFFPPPFLINDEKKSEERRERE